VHCLKYRIIEAIERDYGERRRNEIIGWTGERPNTWRNTNYRCSNAATALITLGQQSTQGGLTTEQDYTFQLLKVLLSGLRVISYPLHPLISLIVRSNCASPLLAPLTYQPSCRTTLGRVATSESGAGGVKHEVKEDRRPHKEGRELVSIFGLKPLLLLP
jgi:hypothetical protein